MRDPAELTKKQRTYLELVWEDQAQALREAGRVLRESFGAGHVGGEAPTEARSDEAADAGTAGAPAPSRSAGGPAAFDVYEEADGHHFRLKGADGQVLLTSQGYKSRTGALKGIDCVRRNAPNAARYVAREDAGKPAFDLRAGNNQVIARSTPFASEGELERAKDTVRQVARSAAVSD